MKTISRYFQTFAILAAGLLAARLAEAQDIWTGGGAANQNWSDTANWSGGGVPGATTNAIFTNNANAATSPGTVDNIVDNGFVGPVGILQYANTNTSGTSGFFHTTQIGVGQTLTVISNMVVGLTNDMGGNMQVNASFTGQGTLNVTNPTGYLIVSVGSATSGSQGATLNMTNLNNFTATLGGVDVGIYNTPWTSLVARQRGFLYLAKTNVITFAGNAPTGYPNESQIEIGENVGNGANTAIPMYLGMMNTINVSTITVGGDKQGSGGLLAFNPVFTNTVTPPVAVINGTNGPTSRVSTWVVADNSHQTTSGSGTVGTVDFSNGILDALVNTLIIGEGESGTGTGSGTGTFTFTAGTNNVNTLYVGYTDNTGASGGPATGTMNVNGTGTLIVNNAICISFHPSSGSAADASGTLNITNGTVLAATITNGVSGGANSTANINVNGGLLGITSLLGSIGTSTSPLKTVSLTNATLQLPISGIQTNMVVNTLNMAGTTNIINISSIPGNFITYPNQVSLIAYGSLITNTSSGFFNIGVSNLPGTYQGYISNNTANSSIDLVLTSGPTSISTLTWSGAASATWNKSSVNWSNGASSAIYSDGVATLFNDTAPGPTGISIASTVSPASMTFANNVLPYSFSGAGVGGAGGLTMNGSGTVLFTNSGNTFPGNISVNSGTVQFGNGGTSGNLPATGSVLDNGNLILNHSGNVSLPNAISGAGTLTENGTSTLTISATNSFSGTAIVNGGTMVLNGVLSGNLTNALGTTIGGAGTNAGTVNASGLVQPSAATGTPSIFTVGALNLSSGATLGFDLSGNNTSPGSGVNDLLAVNGNLNANNNTVYLNFQTAPTSGSTYQLINFSGSQNGSLSSTVAGTHFGATLAQGSSPVQVTISGTGANLKWDSTVVMTNNLWNIGGSSNWLNQGTSLQDVFYQGDNVTFDDSVAGVTNIISIPSGSAVSPTIVSNNSSTVNYTIAGPGQITGNVNIIKQGNSTLTMSSANVNFTGTATIAGGTSLAANGNAFGGSGTVIVTNGGTLNIDGNGLGEVQVDVSGAGVGGNGAIVNSGADQIHAINMLSLSGDATFGGTGRWDIRYNGSDLGVLNTTDGQTHNITKVGNNVVALVDVTIDPNVGNIDIQGGQLGLQLNTASQSGSWIDDTTHTISVENGAELELNTLGVTYPLYRTVALNNGSTLISDAGNNEINGSVTLQGNATISVTGGTVPYLEIAGPISGSGNLIVNGSVPLVLTMTNTYTGNTLINAGTLQLGYGVNDAFIYGSSNIIVAANAILDVSEMSDQTIIVTNGQTLQGNGSVYGNVIVAPGATISAGTSSTATGLLTITNTLVLQGNAWMKLNPSTAIPTNDVINVIDGASITNGGTLTVTNVSASPFAIGMTFQLFTATNFSGVFSSVSPATPGPGLAWNTNNLSTGTLSVVAGAVAPKPGITSITLNGTQLVISGTNGVASEQYNVLTTTNLLQPIANWTVLPAGTFSGNAFSITNTVNPNAAQDYYLIRVP